MDGKKKSTYTGLTEARKRANQKYIDKYQYTFSNMSVCQRSSQFRVKISFFKPCKPCVKTASPAQYPL